MELNEVEVEALKDTGWGKTLVKNARGPFTLEDLRMQCINGDVNE